jgi:transposase InsO family protein
VPESSSFYLSTGRGSLRWFFNLEHARHLIEAWRREYNEERPKKILGGLTPSEYARQLAKKSVTLTAGL